MHDVGQICFGDLLHQEFQPGKWIRSLSSCVTLRVQIYRYNHMFLANYTSLRRNTNTWYSRKHWRAATVPLCFQRPLKNECSMVAKQHVPLTRLIISNRIHQTCFLSLYASLGSMRNITQVSRNHDMSRVYRIIAILCFELPRSWTKNNVV